MKNIVDYVEETLEPLAQRPFGPVDSLVLSQFSYIHLEEFVQGPAGVSTPVSLKELLRAECFDSLFYRVRAPQENRRLLFALAASPRFRDIGAVCAVNDLNPDLQKQFSAVTFLLGDDTVYLAFRGTDATLVGWKEDFNMAFLSPVPSQEAAVSYVETVARRTVGRLRLGGHSKGGNLAVYAAMMCSGAVQERIDAVYSHDGPGFQENILQSSAFAAIQGRVQKTLPKSSLIGMLLEHQENYTVVESSRIGIMQHDPFSWVVSEGEFQNAGHLSGGARYRSRALNDWLAALDRSQRERFVDTLFAVLEAGGVESFAEPGSSWQKRMPAMLAAARQIDPETRRYVLQTVRALAAISLKELPHKTGRRQQL